MPYDPISSVSNDRHILPTHSAIEFAQLLCSISGPGNEELSQLTNSVPLLHLEGTSGTHPSPRLLNNRCALHLCRLCQAHVVADVTWTPFVSPYDPISSVSNDRHILPTHSAIEFAQLLCSNSGPGNEELSQLTNSVPLLHLEGTSGTHPSPRLLNNRCALHLCRLCQADVVADVTWTPLVSPCPIPHQALTTKIPGELKE